MTPVPFSPTGNMIPPMMNGFCGMCGGSKNGFHQFWRDVNACFDICFYGETFAYSQGSSSGGYGGGYGQGYGGNPYGNGDGGGMAPNYPYGTGYNMQGTYNGGY